MTSNPGRAGRAEVKGRVFYTAGTGIGLVGIWVPENCYGTATRRTQVPSNPIPVPHAPQVLPRRGRNQECPHLAGITEELERIDLPAVEQHFEMQIRPGGTARGPHQGDRLP